jgi:hypothetical protein
MLLIKSISQLEKRIPDFWIGKAAQNNVFPQNTKRKAVPAQTIRRG